MKKLIILALMLMLTIGGLTSCLLFSVTDIIDAITDPTPGYYTYDGFSNEEKALFQKYVGVVIPFAPTDEYEVRGYYGDEDYEEGMRFSTYGNTEEDFEKYKALFSDYKLLYTETDEDGDLWYVYQESNAIINLSFYYYGRTNVIDVLIYVTEDVITDLGVLTNDGKGLPEGGNGIYTVDFTKSKHAKNVTELQDYEDGCPTVGKPKVLVIPVQFSDATASSRGYTISSIERAFKGKAGTTDYYSVWEYYYLSSYGKLDLDITVLNSWFIPEHPSYYYKIASKDYDGQRINIGDQMIMNEALDYLDDKMDLSEYDSDGNGIIDAVVMINTMKVDEDSDFTWAYRYWNIYTDDNDNFYEYDGVRANDYLWMSCGFLHEKSGFLGIPSYNDKSVMNTYTFIHEFGHILGANDYYTLDELGTDPMHGLDVMDSTKGDHNPFTKFHYGWITESRLVTTDDSVTVVLNPFKKTGDTLILANDWDDSLGAYQEYYVLAFYTNDELNGKDAGYYDYNCLVVYHVNASLYYEEYDVKYSYYLNNDNTKSNNTSEDDNTLIELQLNDGRNGYNYCFAVGSSLPETVDHSGEPLGYTFTVDAVANGGIKITITKIK